VDQTRTEPAAAGVIHAVSSRVHLPPPEPSVQHPDTYVVASGGRSGLLTRCVLAGCRLLRSQVGGKAVDSGKPFNGNHDSDDAGLMKSEIPASSVPGVNQMSVSLLIYHAWTPHTLSHPDTTPLPAIIVGLQEIQSLNA
jgi:hypothetical protein